MTIARIYNMHAKEGMSAELETALRGVLAAVSRLPGSQGAELLRDLGNEHRFILFERWDSVEAHKAGQAEFAKLDMRPMMEALDGPPDGGYFDPLATS